MAYVDHAFSISDEDLMIGTSYTVSNRPPVKEISLAVSLLLFGILGIVSGFFMAYNRYLLHSPRVSSVYPGLLLYTDRILRIQRIQRFLLLKHTLPLTRSLLSFFLHVV
ncbi:unnamed protein product [Brassica napus]|uniref:(rape) hypothetical protein n=1 Tax=Brassica napus TaxID=3708 RepID=A0A816YAS3_BRANA|nr:unnamed protein product [Brassica napus]